MPKRPLIFARSLSWGFFVRLLFTSSRTGTSTIGANNMVSSSYPEHEDACSDNYFAIGSMMNPISVKNRDLNLEVNAPAMPGQLLDHKLVFYGSGGMAEAVPCKGCTMHGVVYRKVPTEQLQELDHLERTYTREKATARLYPPNSNPDDPNSFLEAVTVYCRDPNVERGPHVDRPPSGRYLQIMVDGARHYGVDAAYIETLQKQECRPRPSPEDYISFPVQEGAMEKTMSRKEVEEKGDGKNGNPLYICCNGRVIEFCEDHDSPMFQDLARTFDTYGRDLEIFLGRVQYDPKYGTPNSVDEVSPEESAYREHSFCQHLQDANSLHKWQVIAKLEDSE